ncbi:MAG TPA: hypothetical protein VFT36_03905 [Methylomirabilota bacterium]|nr:hypothetical protein [Methylomirabilota bacterium]
MLRIVSVGNGHGATTLVLEGRLIGPWVGELRDSCQPALDSATPLVLDLGKVTFVDREGIELLRMLADRDAQLTNCAPFVAEQLRAPGG